MPHPNIPVFMSPQDSKLANDNNNNNDNADQIERLVSIMAALRNPVGGCAWDLKQTSSSIAQYAIEEAYEVVEAIEQGTAEDIRDELGDLLLQVVFHCQMSREKSGFDIQDVARSVCNKMLRRHPHVFDTPQNKTADGVKMTWEEIKAQERAEKTERHAKAGLETPKNSALDDIPQTQPALPRSDKLQTRAARVGFDHPNLEIIYAKHYEELDEVKDAAENGTLEELELEVGDLLFTAAAIARRLNVDPETALRKANNKFEKRFRAVEQLADGNIDSLPLKKLNQLWEQVKEDEKMRATEAD